MLLGQVLYRPWILIWRGFLTPTPILETFLIDTIRGACYWHLEGIGQDVAKNPTMHRTVPHSKTHLVQNLSGQ